MKKMIDWIEVIISVIPIVFIGIISIWHAFGKVGVQPLKAIYFLSNHLFFIYFAITIILLSHYLLLRKIMAYIVIPYFTIKIVYQLAIYCRLSACDDKISELCWGFIFIVTTLVGSIMLWNRLRRIG